MKLVMVPHFFNHHQEPLAEALRRRLGEDYCFVATQPVPEDRRALGYRDGAVPDYVLRAYESEAAQRQAMERIHRADVVLAGSAPEAMLRRRIRDGKLVLRYAERPMKQGVEPMKFLPRLLRWHWRNPVGKPVYLLAASGFAPADFQKMGLFRRKCCRFGYFPETRYYDNLDGFFDQKEPKTILWVGRFVEWKHPEAALEVAARLEAAGCGCRLEYIGTGPLEETLRQEAVRRGLTDCVTFCGAMAPEQVRRRMERAGILLVTSGRREGWGVVVNEAMNSGCAAVVNRVVGAAPYLLRPGENGLVYRQIEALIPKVRFLLEHPDEQRRLGREAYRTITEVWNPETAAQRLIEWTERLLAGEPWPDLYESGPCSRAEIIKEDWYDED